MFKCVQMVNGQTVARKTNFLRITRKSAHAWRGRERMFNTVTSVDICALPSDFSDVTGEVIAFFNTLYDGIFAEHWASRDVLVEYLTKRKIRYSFGAELTEANLLYLFGLEALEQNRQNRKS